MPRESSNALRVACIGECMIELSLRADGSLHQGFAGDTANLAVYLARLLPAAQIAYVTALGKDPFSDRMLAGWQDDHIDTRLVRRLADRLPGLYWIDTDASGERSFYYWREQSAARAMFSDAYLSDVQASLAGFDLVCLSGITLAILPADDRAELLATLGSLRRAGSRIVFDSNYRPRLWPVVRDAQACHRDAMAVADIVIASFDDERALFGDESAAATRARISAAGLAEVVVRQGHGDSLLLADGQSESVPPAVAGQVVDTTGAGDAFDAAYLAARLSGQPGAAAARAGHRLAAQVVAVPGAILLRATTPALEALLA
ncbi:MAG: sugar kinase [Chromatiales bacterium]|nr:MAG: sugar kinase [Chromatiales bacterium]